MAIDTTTTSKAMDSLPQSFTTIPPLILQLSTPEVPRQDGELLGSGLFLPNGFQGEREWLENVFEKLNQVNSKIINIFLGQPIMQVCRMNYHKMFALVQCSHCSKSKHILQQ